MSGLIVGLLIGTGLFTTWSAFWDRAEKQDKARSRVLLKVEDSLTQAGLSGVSFNQLLAGCALSALLGAAVAFVFFPVPALIAVIAIAAAFLPWTLVRSRALKQQRALSRTWPEVIEHLGSGVRAGLSLPEAVSALAHRGPTELRRDFAEFAADYRVSGNFSRSLDRLKGRLADPIADRVIEALRLARDVGGNDLSRLLRNLTQFLHDDLRTRGEIAARQSWTVAGSRLAVAAPWAILAVLSTRSEAATAYKTPLGSTLILLGALITIAAYRVMIQVGRLPNEERVLR